MEIGRLDGDGDGEGGDDEGVVGKGSGGEGVGGVGDEKGGVGGGGVSAEGGMGRGLQKRIQYKTAIQTPCSTLNHIQTHRPITTKILFSG